MRLRALALGLMTVWGASVAAQDSTQTLQQALKQVPQVVLSAPEAIQISFLDVQAWRDLEKAGPSADAMRRLSISQAITPLQSIGFGLDKWSANAHIPFDELSYFAGFGQSPSNVTYWGLKDKPSAAKFADRLKQAGFKPVDGDVAGLLANGEPNKPDMTKATGQQPWRGTMGMPTFVLPLDTALVQAAGPTGMKTLSQTAPSVADSEIVGAAVTGLKDEVPSDGGRIVQAAVISSVFGLQGVDPAKVLSGSPGDLESAKQKLQAAAAASGRGIPPYFAGIIADVQVKDVPAVVISLSYADCAAAQQAVDGVGAAWKQGMAATVQADVKGRTVQAGKLCAAVVTLTAAKAENAGNPILSQIMNRYMQRDASVLQIGTSQ
ncbi:hypothetical protein LMG26690_00087 [Achromobacter animicus]|uniref:Imelysin-like domain-containing protein n=1 Tax=Achromobacter animicus TaxID=1389935 RepID=A0A6S6YXB7_9BURK|nr:hypothetical protein [Achromobacter animicus]CAB3651596.1 hypothetical protein LMG26690_00087 [Achromobacter animicus]